MSKLSNLTTGRWNVDASHSEVGFAARHAMVSKIRGRFTDFSAAVTVTQPFEKSTVEATVQMASIYSNSEDRDVHLMSSDFFDVENNPTMTFRSTKVTDDTLEGDLTIKGVTKPVTFDLDFFGISAEPGGGTRAGFEATTEINSKDFNLTWSIGLEKGSLVIGEKVRIALDVELVQV
jgi:polyisoprenoid-binding protein YceI